MKSQDNNNKVLANIWFLLKSIFLMVLKIRNIKTLFYRICTVAMVCVHYFVVEKIKIEDRVKNEYNLASFIIVWHLIFMYFKNFEETRRTKNKNAIVAITTMIIVFAISITITMLITPFLAYFNFEITSLKTNIWTMRYIMMFIYIIQNIFINTFPLVNNFLFFISDGIILSQLTSVYLVNEFSMSALLTVLPFLFVL